MQALILAAFTATRLTDETRRWFLWHPIGGTAAFDAVRAQWAQLVSDEARWRGRFSDYRDLGGCRIPTRAEVEWVLDTGPFTCWRGEVTAFEPR